MLWFEYLNNFQNCYRVTKSLSWFQCQFQFRLRLWKLLIDELWQFHLYVFVLSVPALLFALVLLDGFICFFISFHHCWWLKKVFLSHFQEDKTFLKYQSFKHLSPPHRMNAWEIICYLTTMREFSEHMHFTENILNRVIS